MGGSVGGAGGRAGGKGSNGGAGGVSGGIHGGGARTDPIEQRIRRMGSRSINAHLPCQHAKLRQHVPYQQSLQDWWGHELAGVWHQRTLQQSSFHA